MKLNISETSLILNLITHLLEEEIYLQTKGTPLNIRTLIYWIMSILKHILWWSKL